MEEDEILLGSPPAPDPSRAPEPIPELDELPITTDGPIIGSSSSTRDEVPPLTATTPKASGPGLSGTTDTDASQGNGPEESAEAGGGWNGSIRVSLDDLDELTIISRAQDGDPEAFEWLISAYQGGLYRLCFRMLNDRTEAEDVVQESLIAAWRSLPKLSVPQAFVPWLYRTATNKCLDALRVQKRRPAHPSAPTDLEDNFSSGDRYSIRGTPNPDPAKHYEHRAEMKALSDLLQTVPPGPRACWLLREVHEFSYLEIAAIVQLPESTVRGRIARAKRLLAEGMAPWR